MTHHNVIRKGGLFRTHSSRDKAPQPQMSGPSDWYLQKLSITDLSQSTDTCHRAIVQFVLDTEY